MLVDLHFQFGCFVENGWKDGERGGRENWSPDNWVQYKQEPMLAPTEVVAAEIENNG